MPTGLGILSEGKELPLEELPGWSEDGFKVLPMVWKNPVNGNLHYQVHPCAALALEIAPPPACAKTTEETLYPDGTILTDLKEVRDLLYKMQRPGIAPPVG
jgi:hypothetical protein